MRWCVIAAVQRVFSVGWKARKDKEERYKRALTVVLGPESDEQECHDEQFRAVVQFQPGATPDAQKRHAKSAQAEQDAIVALGDAAWRGTVIGLPDCR